MVDAYIRCFTIDDFLSALQDAEKAGFLWGTGKRPTDIDVAAVFNSYGSRTVLHASSVNYASNLFIPKMLYYSDVSFYSGNYGIETFETEFPSEVFA